MPSKARFKPFEGSKANLAENIKSDKKKSKKICGAGAKSKIVKKCTKEKAKDAAIKSSTFIKYSNKATEASREKNVSSNNRSKHKGKKPTKIHPEVQALVKMLTEKLKTLTPESDDDNQCYDDQTETSSTSSSDNSSNGDSSSSSDVDDSNTKSDSDDDTSSSDSSTSSGTAPSSSKKSSSDTSSSGSSSTNCSGCSWCRSTSQTISDTSMVVAKLQKEPLKRKAPIKPKTSSIKNQTKSKSDISAVKPKTSSLKKVNTKPKTLPKKKNPKISKTVKKAKSQPITNSELPSTSNSYSLRSKQSPKNYNLRSSGGLKTKFDHHASISPSPAKILRRSDPQRSFPKANSTFRKSLK